MNKKLITFFLFIYCTVCAFSIKSNDKHINLISFDTKIQNYFPVGRYGKYSSYNYGLTSQLNMDLIKYNNINGFTALTISNNAIILDDINYIIDMSLVFGASYNFNLDNVLPFKGAVVSPGLGYGWMPHLAKGGYWTNGERKRHFFQDQILIAQLELSYNLKNFSNNIDYILVFTPSYVRFLEEEYNGHEIGFNLGLRLPIDNRTKKTEVILKDETKPVFLGSNKQFIEDVTTASASITLDPAFDNTTPNDGLIYRTFISNRNDYQITNIKDFSGQSIGTPKISIENLLPGTHYFAHTVAIDNADNYIEYATIEFKTVDFLSSSKGFNLGNNAIEVDLRKVLEVEFNTEIDPVTINKNSVYVKSGNHYIKGELLYNDKILKFIPMEDFIQGEKHVFVLSTIISDLNGNTLGSDVEFSFTALDYNDIFAHWKFDGNTNDSSGNNHTATLKSVNTEMKPVFVDINNHGNGGLHFVGGYNWGTYIDLGTIDMGDTFTIAGWVKIEKPPKDYTQKIMTLISNGDAGAKKDGFKVFFNNWSKDDKRIVIETGNGNRYKNSETQNNFIAYDNWYHVAVTIDRTIGKVKLYFNGNEAVTTNKGAILNDFNTNAPLHIAHFKDGYYHYNGYIDDFRIYKKVITAKDIQKIARGN